jgi:hypothetical protein
MFAAEGYIVVAPNYVGYDTSTLGYHPYLNADQQSKDMIDALTAARSALPTADAPDDGWRANFVTATRRADLLPWRRTARYRTPGNGDGVRADVGASTRSPRPAMQSSRVA